MSRAACWLPVLLASALAVAQTAAVELSPDRRAIEEALAVGRSPLERDRRAFHAPYRLIVDRAPIDYVDIVTPFRRLALAAEQRLRLGERSLSQRQAQQILAAAPGGIDVLVELTFHPMHALVRVPDYEVRLVTASRTAIEPRRTDRIPRFGPRVDGVPVPLPGAPGGLGAPGANPMLGGTVIAAFDGLALETAGVYEVVVVERGKELARGRIALAGLR